MNFLTNTILMTFISLSICVGQTENINVSGFDISYNDKQLLIACKQQKIRSIYEVDLETQKAKLLISGKENLDFFNPQYSPNGKKIVFIGYFNKDVNNAAVFISNTDGTQVRQLTKGNEIINQAIFSKYDPTHIIFIKAGSFENYSSFAPKQAHHTDLYSVNIDDTTTKKITDLNAYGIYKISELDSNNFLMHLPGGKKGGAFLYNKKTREKFRIVPGNDPRNEPSQYYTPKYSFKFNTLGLTAPYELYIMDMDTKIATRVFRSDGMLKEVHDFLFF